MDELKLKKIRRIERTCKRLSRMNLGYLLGGARNGNGISPPTGKGDEWTDCSGFVGYILNVAGIRLDSQSTIWTGTLQNEGKEGTSPFLTLFIKEPMKTDGHVIVRLRHHPRWRKLLGMSARYRWVQCGGRDNPKSGGGPTYFRPTESRIAEFPIRRHFEEL